MDVSRISQNNQISLPLVWTKPWSLVAQTLMHISVWMLRQEMGCLWGSLYNRAGELSSTFVRSRSFSFVLILSRSLSLSFSLSHCEWNRSLKCALDWYMNPWIHLFLMTCALWPDLHYDSISWASSRIKAGKTCVQGDLKQFLNVIFKTEKRLRAAQRCPKWPTVPEFSVCAQQYHICIC